MARVAVSPPPGAFLQATLDGEAMLQASIAEIAGADRHFVDLFSGCGTLSLPLLDQAAGLLAVEHSERALAALKAGANAAGLGGRVNVKVRNLFNTPLMEHELAGFDMAILDPPRRGAAARCPENACQDRHSKNCDDILQPFQFCTRCSNTHQGRIQT